MTAENKVIQDLALPLERDLFLRSLIRELAGTLEEVIGTQEASGYISLVGQKIGDWINGLYTKSLGVPRLTPEQIAEVLVDLKKRIQGDFSVVEQSEEKIVFRNTACPFGDKVLGRPSMCMMTSNVFGVIAAQNMGYAKVVLNETIAGQQPCCTVTVYLTSGPEADRETGREYFGD